MTEQSLENPKVTGSHGVEFPREHHPLYAAQLQSALVKSRAPIDQLVATLRRRLAARHPTMADERASA